MVGSTVGSQQKDGKVDEQPGDTFNKKKLSKLKEKIDVANQFNPKKYNCKSESFDHDTFNKNDKTNSRLEHGAAFEVIDNPK